MTKHSERSIKVSATGAEEAAKMLERLSRAADKASASLESLSKNAHGGVTIKIVGDLCEVVIDPAKVEQI